MDGFHYVNIFATKGIEYLFIIGFLILFIFYMRSLLGGQRGDGELEDRKEHGH